MSHLFDSPALKHSALFGSLTLLTQWVGDVNWAALLGWLVPYLLMHWQRSRREGHAKKLQAQDRAIAQLVAELAEERRKVERLRTLFLDGEGSCSEADRTSP